MLPHFNINIDNILRKILKFKEKYDWLVFSIAWKSVLQFYADFKYEVISTNFK